MRTLKSALLDQFLNEKVLITTEIHTSMQMNEMESIEGPLVVEGVFLDYDQEFILLGQEGRDSVEVIKRSSVVGIKQKTAADELMADMNKPDAGDMN